MSKRTSSDKSSSLAKKPKVDDEVICLDSPERPELAPTLIANQISSEDESMDEQLFLVASQVEEKFNKSLKVNLDDSYSNFQPKELRTSTQRKYFPSRNQPTTSGTAKAQRTFQNIPVPGKSSNVPASTSQAENNFVHPGAVSQVRPLQNKVNALEIQIKRLKESHSKDAQELEELRAKNRKLELKKNELEEQCLSKDKNHNLAISNLSKQISGFEKELKQKDELLKTLNEKTTNNAPYIRIHRSTSEEFEEKCFYKSLKAIQLNYVENKSGILQEEIEYLQIKLTQAAHGQTRDVYSILSHSAIIEICRNLADEILKAEKPRKKKHFMKQEFAYQYHIYLTIQHREERKLNKYYVGSTAKRSWEKEEEQLIGDKKLFPKEMSPEFRQVVALIACLVKYSKQFAEELLLFNTSSTPDKFECFVHFITKVTDPYILKSRRLYQYSGLTRALALLLVNLSSYYNEFENLKKVDAIFSHLFEHILMMASSDPCTLISLVQFIINISLNPKRIGLLKQFCINHPSSTFEESIMYRIYKIPRNACKLQVLFLLLQSTFPYYEQITNRNLELVHTLTKKINLLSEIFLEYSEEIFIKINTDCDCFESFIIALIILNDKVIKSFNMQAENYLFSTKSIIPYGLPAILNVVCCYKFCAFPFLQHALNDIYYFLRCACIHVENFNRVGYLKLRQLLSTPYFDKNMMKLKIGSIRVRAEFQENSESRHKNQINFEKKAALRSKYDILLKNQWKEKDLVQKTQYQQDFFNYKKRSKN